MDLRALFWFFGLTFLILVSLGSFSGLFGDGFLLEDKTLPCFHPVLLFRSQLQLAHVCSDAYRPWHWSTLITGCLILSWLASDICSMLYVAVALLAVVWLHMEFSIVLEMADILQIPIFTLKGASQKAS